MWKNVLFTCVIAVAEQAAIAQGLRGVNVAENTTYGEILAFATMDGVNIVRHQIFYDELMGDDQWLIDRMAKIRHVANACSEFGVKYVLDFHAFIIEDGLDACLTSRRKKFLNLWEKIIRRLRNTSTKVYAFELKSEPKGRVVDVNAFYARAVQKLRPLTNRPFIVQPPYGNIDLIGKLQLPNDGKLIVSGHHYFPEPLTHMGIEYPGNHVPYPNTDAVYPDSSRRTAGYRWTKRGLRNRLNKLAVYREENNVSIIIGEFSSNIDFVENGTDQWLTDSMDLFEEFGFDYTYHIANEAFVWRPDNGRWALLRRYFGNNELTQ